MSEYFEDNDELIRGFIEESRELLRHAEEDALVLEKNPDDQARINRVFRSFHTIKGNAGFLNFTKISRFAHESESFLVRIREGKLKITTDISNLMLHIIDRIMLMMKEPENSEHIETAELEERIKALLKDPEDGDKQKARFLIAEGEGIQREILKLMLEDEGDCDFAGDGGEAIEKFTAALEAAPYFFVFVNSGLPKMNGIDTTKEIRRIEKEKGIQLLDEVNVVLSTEEDDVEMIFKAHCKAGVTTCLNKPVSGNRLRDIITAKMKFREFAVGG